MSDDRCEMCGWSPTRVPKAEYHFTLHIDGWSRNQIKDNKKKWNVYRDWRDRCLFLMKKVVVGIPKATGPRYGIITRHWAKRKRAYDHDNWVGGCKPVLDTMKACGLIIDDSTRWWRGYYKQVKSETGEDYISVKLMEE